MRVTPERRAAEGGHATGRGAAAGHRTQAGPGRRPSRRRDEPGLREDRRAVLPAGCRLRPAKRKQVGRLHARSPRRPGHDRRERRNRGTRGRHPHGAGGSPGARRPGGRAAGGAGRDEAGGRRDDGQARGARSQPPHGDARPAGEGRALRGNAKRTRCRCEGQAPRASRPWGARTLREGAKRRAKPRCRTMDESRCAPKRNTDFAGGQPMVRKCRSHLRNVAFRRPFECFACISPVQEHAHSPLAVHAPSIRGEIGTF